MKKLFVILSSFLITLGALLFLKPDYVLARCDTAFCTPSDCLDSRCNTCSFCLTCDTAFCTPSDCLNSRCLGCSFCDPVRCDIAYCSASDCSLNRCADCDFCFATATVTPPGGGQGTAVGAPVINCPSGGRGIDSAIGCIPVENTNAFVTFLLGWGMGIGGGIAFLLIVLAGFQIITSSGDPKRLQAGKELLTSAIAGLLLIIFSVFILRLVGADILGIFR